jgi:hypothetical protein
MPTSIDPPLADDEIECGRCGARFYYELTRCPNCGVNVYEPDDEPNRPQALQSPSLATHQTESGVRFEQFLRHIFKKPYAADELFGASINQAELFDNLLTKVGGDHAVAERLIDFEHKEYPQGNRIAWIERAIQRWERDNQARQAT